ncbi:MAG TPA: hypothetical protein GX017_03440, partial [Clostridiales bacterium]|nr:hypothetical protein [Clostridiales bacterium]
EIKYIGWTRFKIPYRKDEVSFRDFDLEIQQDGFFIREIYHEMEEIRWDKSMGRLKEKLEEMALKEVRESMPPGAKIIDKRVKYDMIESEKAIAVLYVEALEDIAEQQIIVTQ